MSSPGEIVRPPIAPGSTPGWGDIAQRWSRLLFGGVAFVTFLGLFAPWSTLAEILTHFRAIYALGAFAALLLAGLGCSWKFRGWCAGLLVWQLAGIVPWYVTESPPAPEAGVRLKVITANVNAGNRGFDRFLELIDKEHPDVVCVQELSRSWAEALSALEASYPYRATTVRQDFFGLGLYSRFPIENVVDDDPVGYDIPVMRAEIVIGDRRVQIVNVHLAPPEGHTLTEVRYRQYEWLTEYISTIHRPVIVAGDFNCTMWSPLYKTFVCEGKLTNAREGRGIMPTWLRVAGPLHALPLDHIFVGGGPTFHSAHLGTPIGSDHCPVVAEVRLPGSPALKRAGGLAGKSP